MTNSPGTGLVSSHRQRKKQTDPESAALDEKRCCAAGRRAFTAFRQQHDMGDPVFCSDVPGTSSMLLAQSAKCPAEGRNPSLHPVGEVLQ
jgi:hypothetical protein